jgi:hypothetical protein
MHRAYLNQPETQPVSETDGVMASLRFLRGAFETGRMREGVSEMA